jgi:CBS domain containing-hemolysin-like protein
MNGGDLGLVAGAGLLVVLAGLFAAADAALAGYSLARAQELEAQGRPGARRLVAVLTDRSGFLNTAIFLRLACEVGAIVVVALWVNERVEGWWPTVVIAVGAMLVVSFVVVGVGPRTLGLQHADRVALWSALPLWALTRVLGPFPTLLILVGNAITPGRGFREGPFSSETELRELVDMAEASAVIESEERRMIHSVFEFGDTTVREVMVPRNDVVYIETGKNLRQTLSLFLRSGFSRVPVVGENLDEVLGLAYLKDIVRRDFEAPEVEVTEKVDQVMRPVHWVPDSKPVDDLLREMQANSQQIAIVVDEYGGTAGLITIEDLVEEIVGEIVDEYDQEEPLVEPIDPATIRVDAKMPIDEVNELLDVELPREEWDTVGGLVFGLTGRVPVPGETVTFNSVEFRTERVTGRRINKVVITKTPPAEEPAEG